MSHPTPTDTEAFHAGELAVQERAGARDCFAGHRVPIRDFMPEQHRDFFAQLPFAIVGSVDAQGQPWASVLSKPPGFIRSPDPQHLTVHALPLASDPLHANLVAGSNIGLLGIEPRTRRRNRMNGVVEFVTDAGFAVEVRQSFGNCPKYIQARKPEYVDRDLEKISVVEGSHLDAGAQEIIANADTFFIATSYPVAAADKISAHGVDVSHRGGKPGFVHVDGDTLTVPDFIGNFFFNTLGNIALNPRAGLLVIDFESGDLLYLAVDASIVWDEAEVKKFAGAERLLRLRVRSMKRVTAALPLRWSAAQLSSFLERTG